MTNELDTFQERHPSRAIVLAGGADEIAARAYAHGRATAGGRVVTETVRIDAPTGAHEQLAAAARAVLVGDLPTALWWSSQRPPALCGDLFFELASLCERVVYDSRGWHEPARGVVAVADWTLGDSADAPATPHTEAAAPAARRGPLPADLAWLALRHWRRRIGESLDPATLPGALETISQVRIEHGPHALPKAWLLIGWLASRLGWEARGGDVQPGTEIEWRFASARGPVSVIVTRASEGLPTIRTANIEARPAAGPLRVHFERIEPGRLCASFEGAALAPCSHPAPDDERATTLAWELSNRSGDPQFRQALRHARAMAKALPSGP